MRTPDAPLYDALREHLRRSRETLEKQAQSTPEVEVTEPCLIASGSGDSLAAAITLSHTIRDKLAVHLDPADALATRWLRSSAGSCLLVALSVGGRTRTLVELARQHIRRGGRVLAVTADPQSPLARASHKVIPLVTGEPSGGVGGLRHLAMLVALARAFQGENPVPRALGHPRPRECPRFSQPWTYVGAGDSRGTALFASLKANEALGVPNPSTSVEEILHAQAFAYPQAYLILHPAHAPGTLKKRIKTAVDTLKGMGRVVEWGPAGTPFETALAHSLHLLQCLEEEAREKRVDTVVYKKHPHLPRLTEAIYGEGL